MPDAPTSTIVSMRLRFEEEPDEDPDEPDEEPEDRPEARQLVAQATTAGTGGREFEYRTEAISATELHDGHSLADRLTAASAEGWDLVDVITAADASLILTRRPRRRPRESRPVGFAPPDRR